jgi:hypothetical protein
MNEKRAFVSQHYKENGISSDQVQTTSQDHEQRLLNLDMLSMIHCLSEGGCARNCARVDPTLSNSDQDGGNSSSK